MYEPYIAERFIEIVSSKNRLVKYYHRILEYIRVKTDKEQIKIIIEEEIKHMRMLKSIHVRVMGGQVIDLSEEQIKREAFVKCMERIIYLETKISNITKTLMFSIPDIRIKNGLYYIFADDQRHTDISLFVYKKYI